MPFVDESSAESLSKSHTGRYTGFYQLSHIKDYGKEFCKIVGHFKLQITVVSSSLQIKRRGRVLV